MQGIPPRLQAQINIIMTKDISESEKVYLIKESSFILSFEMVANYFGRSAQWVKDRVNEYKTKK